MTSAKISLPPGRTLHDEIKKVIDSVEEKYLMLFSRGMESLFVDKRGKKTQSTGDNLLPLLSYME